MKVNSNVPNILTAIRVMASPLVVILLFVNWPWHYLIAVIVFALVMLTDVADGYLARKYNIISKFGMFWDPIADKLVINIMLITLMYLDIFPLWLILLIFARELIVNGFRSFATSQKIYVGAISAGKIKALSQTFAIISAELYLFLNVEWFKDLAYWLLILSLIVSVFGLMLLYKNNWPAVMREFKTNKQ